MKLKRDLVHYKTKQLGSPKSASEFKGNGGTVRYGKLINSKESSQTLKLERRNDVLIKKLESMHLKKDLGISRFMQRLEETEAMERKAYDKLVLIERENQLLFEQRKEL